METSETIDTLVAAKSLFNERSNSLKFFPVDSVPVLQRGTVIIGDGAQAQDWPLAESGLKDLAVILQYRQVAKSDDYDLIELVTNYLLNKSDSPIRYYEAVISDDQIIGFKHRMRPFLPGNKIIDAIGNGLDSSSNGSELTCNHFSADDSGFNIAMTTDKLQLEPRKGDITNGGVKIKFSDLSYTDVFVTPYTNRLICTNGAVHMVQGKSTRIPVYNCEADAIVKQLVESVDYSKRYIHHEVTKQLDLSVNLRVDCVQSVMRIVAEHHLSEGFLNLVLNYLSQENDGTFYSVVQAFTAAANYHDLSEHERDTLQNLGGHLLEHVSVPRCSACYAKMPIK